MINESKTLFQKLVKNKKILATLIVVVVLAVAIPVAILASSKANNRKEAASSSPAGSSLDKTAAVAGDKSSTDNEKNAAPTPADTNATKPTEPAKEATNPPAEPSSVPKTSAYVYGNTSGNLTNGAGVASDGKFVYYNNPDDGYKLYKSLPDGSSKSKVMDSSAGSINIIDGWIYYYGGMTDSGIYKISTNGSNKKKLASARTLGIAVVNDWIYFMDQASPENYVIYKIKTDGSEKTKISLGNNPSLLCIEASSLVVIEDWIYLPLLNKVESRTQLFRVKTDGSGSQKVLNNNPRFFSISDNFIYYASNNYNEIRKSKVDGTGEKAIYTLPVSNHYLYSINASNGYLYYSTDSDSDPINNLGIYKIKTDGSGVSKILDVQARFMCIAFDWIYFETNGEVIESYSNGEHKITIGGTSTLLKIKTDGTKLSKR